ncbi:GvpL/GvpF family gas vesicle protein [Kitasatospora sp. DSM 101779]|uniref:GvpL/GvpF family gas vesicle protein n=1 Tax=Kitasatospora sp. DSM 101779 TaxID=2853165 RepID=UPI0021D8D126|nr:GvpL/GvpF family gas vesicle protein [Kitasatospora sp. DSM 101779]MCU7820270.1 GvpL/GvpF family gas vesicle protein [Kitasatospora sp. DSM 101779]
MALYVYAVTSQTHPARLDGMTGVGDPPEELSTVSTANLTAIVSAAPDGLRARRRDVLAHQEVLQHLMADGTVLPLRFGATASDEPQVRGALEDRADFYHQRLEALAGCTEYLLKGQYEEEALLRQILQESAEARQLNEESRRTGDTNVKMRLGELVAREVQAREKAAAADAVEALRPFAREVHVNEARGEDFVSASFLVEDDRSDEFTAAQQELAEDWGEDVRLRLHGPLPPYTFVQETAPGDGTG